MLPTLVSCITQHHYGTHDWLAAVYGSDRASAAECSWGHAPLLISTSVHKTPFATLLRLSKSLSSLLLKGKWMCSTSSMQIQSWHTYLDVCVITIRQHVRNVLCGELLLDLPLACYSRDRLKASTIHFMFLCVQKKKKKRQYIQTSLPCLQHSILILVIVS